MTPQEQLRVLLAMMLCGAALGAAYDALWLLRTTLFRGMAAQTALDLLFGVLCAAGIIAAALCLRADAIRFFSLSGAAAGMALYRASAGAMLRFAVRRCAEVIKKRLSKAGK